MSPHNLSPYDPKWGIEDYRIKNDLYYSMDQAISQEGFFSDIKNSLLSMLSSAKNQFHQFTFPKSNIVPKLVSLDRGTLNKFTFMTQVELTVELPEGFNGNFLQYGKDLLTVAEITYSKSWDSLNKLERQLGLYANKPELLGQINRQLGLTSITDDLSINTRDVYFSNKYAPRIATLGNILQSKQELVQLVEIHDGLREQILKVDLVKYQTLINKADLKLSGIIIHIKSLDQSSVLPHVAELKELLTSIKYVADWVTYAGVLQYEIMTYLNFVSVLYRRIEDQF